MRSLLPSSLLLSSILAVGMSSAHGQATLITDDFGRGTLLSPVALNGTAPTYVAPSAVSEKWVANSSVTTDGSEAVITTYTAPAGPERTTAYLNIPGLTSSNLNVGGTYTLSFVVNKLSGDSWTETGFGTMTNTADVGYLGGNSAGLWALDNGGGLHIFDEVGGSLNHLGSLPITGSGTVAITITAGAGGVDTFSATLDGNPIPLSTSTATLDPMTQVFLGGFQAMGTVQTLNLNGPTVVVPEPGTWALMLGGLGTLVFVARLRRKTS